MKLKITESQKIMIEKGLPLLKEAAELDPDQVQKALEDAVGETAVLEDFLSPDNMKRFEAAAEFLPKLKEFFGALNTHFEVQKAQQEEAEQQAEEEAARAEEEAAARRGLISDLRSCARPFFRSRRLCGERCPRLLSFFLRV